MQHGILSSRVAGLKPSSTLTISAKANQMKSDGIDVINLSVGEPDFNTPKEACEMAIRGIQDGKTKYTNVDGILALKKAVQSKFKTENDLEFELDEIFVSCGAKQGIFNCFAASLNKGDEVIIPAPYWVSYIDIVSLFGGTPIVIKTSYESNFKLTPKELEDAITPSTKWLILNSPSNPTGEVYTEEELRGLAMVLMNHPHIFVMSDDIYEHLIFDGLKFHNILNIEPKLKERVFVLNGVSKSHAMTGWRIGYGAMKNRGFIKAIVNLQSQSTSNPSSISQEAALGALTLSRNFIAESRHIMQKRRDLVCEQLSKIEGITFKKPSGAFYVFFSVENLIGRKTLQGVILDSDIKITEYLLTEGRVAMVFGDAFGYPGFIRLSYATSEEKLLEAIVRISDAIKKLKFY